MPVNVLDLHRRWQSNRSERSNVDSVRDEIERYMGPYGSLSDATDEAAVRWLRREVWDSTAIEASLGLSASIHGSITSPSGPWYKPAWRTKRLRDNPKAQAWLESCGDVFFDELQDSDFGTEVQSVYQDLVRAGTGVLIEEPASSTSSWKGLDFTAVPLREWDFDEDSRGRVLRGWHTVKWSPSKIVDLCRRRGWQADNDLVEKARSPEADKQRIELVFCLYVREEESAELERRREGNRARYRERRRRSEAQKRSETSKDDAAMLELAGLPPVGDDEPTYPLAQELRSVGGVYFRGDTGKQVGEEVGYYEMPAMVCRWSKTAGSKWGHGPGHIALPAVKRLNARVEEEKVAEELANDPPWGVTELGLLSDRSDQPGAINVFRDKDSVWIMESKHHFDIDEAKIASLQAAIRRIFHADQLQLKDSPQMTAMEAQIRYELMQRLLGAPLNRIESDLLAPLLKIGFGLCLRAGRFPEMPEEVRVALMEEDADFSIEYLGPLARAQRTDKVASVERLLAFAGAMMKMGYPLRLVMAIIDLPTAVREMAKLLGTPASMMKAKEELEQALKQMEKEIQAQAEADRQKSLSEAERNRADALSKLRGPAGGPGPVESMPAQPGPLVSPSMQPTQPFQQPAPLPMG